MQQARARQHSEAFTEYRQRRVVVEHRLARLVQLGIRQSRYFGRSKTRFQLYLAATVANPTLVAAKAGTTGETAAGPRAGSALAAQHFARLLTPFKDQHASEEAIRHLLEVVERNQTEALIDIDYSQSSRVKLMTYHQTKSREADMAIHVYRHEDFFGRGGEPFEEASRLLNVAITRARKRLVLILPHDPHPLVEPFNALRNVQESVLSSM